MGGINGGQAIETASFQVIVSTTTSTTGANWVTLAAHPCNSFRLANFSGTTIEVRYNGSGSGFPVASGGTYDFLAISNTNQLSLRRLDQSNTPVTVVGQGLQP